MNELLKKDITIKTVSVLLAVFLWFIVLNIADPIRSVPLSIPLDVINESKLQEKGIVLNKSKDFPRNVLITVRARDKIVKNLTANDFSAAILDLSKIKSADDNKLRIEGPTYIGEENKKDIQIIEVKPAVIENIDLDRIGHNPFRVEVVQSGNLKKNYKIVKITTTPETLAIQGLDSQIKSVASIKAFVDVTNLDKDLAVKKECKIYNKNGDEIPGLGKNLTVDIKIEVAKEVTVTPVIIGRPARNYIDGARNVKPDKVLIEGAPEILSKIDDLKTEPINIENISGDMDVTKHIILPEGVKLVNSPQDVTISVGIEQLVTKDILISSNDIGFVNTEMDNSLRYEIVTPGVTVTLKGVQKELDKLTPASLKPTVDVNGLKEGVHKLPVKVALPGTVKLVLESIEENPQGNTNTDTTKPGDSTKPVAKDYSVEVKIDKR